MAARPRGPYRQTPNAVIRAEQADRLHEAAKLAERRGWPLDRMITLNFSFTDCESDRMPEAFEYVRDMAVRWYRYETSVGRVQPGDQFAFVWALEHVNDWHHVHWLVHLPRGTEGRFREMLFKWTLRAAGVPQERYFHIRPADRFALDYVTKGMNPADYQGNPRWRAAPGSQGYFRHKRCGVSANLSPSRVRPGA